MNITFTEDERGNRKIHQVRAEQTFSTGDGHGDFCLTAYGESKEEAQSNLRQLALTMARQMESLKTS